MKSYWPKGDEGVGDGRLPLDDGPALVGMVAVAGGLVVAIMVIRFAYTITSAAGYSVLIRSPLTFLVLPGVLVLGWVLVGAGLLDERPLAVPIAAGAFLGAAAVNLGLLGTNHRWPVSAVDPVTPLAVGVQTVFSGYPAGIAWELVTGFGTVVSVLIAGYLGVKAHRDPRLRDGQSST